MTTFRRVRELFCRNFELGTLRLSEGRGCLQTMPSVSNHKGYLGLILPSCPDRDNYWLQLGIAEQLSGDYDKALIHFTHAQTYGPRSYMVKNAIGRNYIYQAIQELNAESAKLLFKQGKEILFDLIDNRDEYQAKAYSTHTYIAGLMKFYRSKRSLRVQSYEIEEAQTILNKVLERYCEDPMFEHLNSAFTAFKIRYAAKSKFNLRELQSSYKDLDVEVDFADVE